MAWINMKTRCYNKKSSDYKDYGGRGIIVCERWKNSFSNFFLDMGLKPSKDHSLDRIEVDGNYKKENCRWATKIEQANNKRSTLFYECAGLKFNLQGWADYFGVNQGNLSNSIKAKGFDRVYLFYQDKYKNDFPNKHPVQCTR